ncbi:MAG TPA: heme exporter protein CcmB [Acidimicrobiales bacterium]|nr:heme exporter protein CcmB [Acidimicrobiales bacterium]
MWRDTWLIAGKDLRIEIRSRVITNQVIPFGGLVLILFAFALDADPATLQKVGGGLFWVAVLFASVLAVQRSASLESTDGAGEGIRLAGVDPAGIFLGKALAVIAQLLVLEIVLSAGVVFLYHLDLRGLPVLAAACLMGTVGLASAGTAYAALSSSTRVRETLLPLLFLPVVSPVLLAATRAWQLTLEGHAGQGAPWLRILGAFSVIYCVIGAVLYESILETSS